MKHAMTRKLAAFMAGLMLALAGQAGAAPRDDTEIYFPRNELSTGKPNLLFILDTSTSMLNSVTGGETRRIDALKTAMKRVLEGASDDVNIGLMRFTAYSGGPVLFPVKQTGSDVSKVPGETATYTAAINQGGNDARENANSETVTLNDRLIEDLFVEETTPREFITRTATYYVDDSREDASQAREEATNKGQMDATGPRLNLEGAGNDSVIVGGKKAGSDIGVLFDTGLMPTESKRTAAQADDAEQRTSTGRGDINDNILNLGRNWVGLRFSGLAIPKDVVIERAYLEFYSRSNTSRAVTYTIRGENSGNAAAYARTNGNLTGRSYVSQTVNWSPGDWDRNQRYQSPDIKTIVQQQVRRSDWRSGNALAFLVNPASRSRSVASFDRNPAQAPRLVVIYSTPRVSPNAFIEDARLEFEIDDPSKTAALTARVYGLLTMQRSLSLFQERIMPDFSDSDYDLSLRRFALIEAGNVGFHNGTFWPNIPSAKQAGYDVQSPDIKEQVQNIVSQDCATRATATGMPRAGCFWAGDTLGFRLTATTSTERVFESQDKTGGSHPPKLTVRYKQPKTAGKEALIGLRFEDIRIPQGATVESASLVFVPAADEKRPMSWTIAAHDADNSAAFAASNSNLSDREKTSASENWTLPDWKAGEAVETSVDLKAVVQAVVNRGGWCGGNALSFLINRNNDKENTARKRKFIAFENQPGDAVRFKYRYTHAGATGCKRVTQRDKTLASSDDAQETTGAGGGVVDLNEPALPLGGNHLIGVRFPDVQVPKDATIIEARLEFHGATPPAGASAAATITITGENAGDAAPYTLGGKISDRAYYSTAVAWAEAGAWQKDRRYVSADIKDIVAEQVKNTDWNAGQALAFKLAGAGGSRRAVSQDGDSGLAPRLVIAYDKGGSGARFKTVRERLEEIVDGIEPRDSTPIQETLIEAANYWRGGAVNYGLRRDKDILLSRITGLVAGLGNPIFPWFRNLENRIMESAAISHPGSYCKSETDCGKADTSASGAEPTNQYGVFNPVADPTDCKPGQNPSTHNCKQQRIKVQTGQTLNYHSPFSASGRECQANFQVLLSDGLAASGGADAQDAIKAITGKTSCRATKPGGGANNASELCSPELAEYLAGTDQSASLSGSQTVKTYTIGFNLAGGAAGENQRAHLKQLADLGKGDYFDATTAESLTEVIENILAIAQSLDAGTFAAAPVAANAFNRLFSRNNIYFGSFAPAPGKRNYENKRWAGNLKKYRICVDPNGPDGNPTTTRDNCTLGDIVDANNNNAISNGQFTTSARNFWHSGSVKDGNNLKQGGAGAGIDDYTKRTLYTDIRRSGGAETTANTGQSLSGTGFKIDKDLVTDNNLTAVWNAVCKRDKSVTANPDAACREDLEWMLGKNVDSEINENLNTTNTRFVFSDVLHSSPVAVTYGRSGTGANMKFIDKILVGTNAGGLHVIDGETGREDWAFLPNELLAKQKELRQNPIASHAYGLDATPVLRIEDKDRDGTIEAGACSGGATTNCGEKVHVYMAMRRGGNSIYALDISDRSAPKFLWRIDAANNPSPTGGIAKGNFSRMGQTFSEPVLARVNTSAGRKTVLIFGGGYDTRLDEDKPPKSDGTKQPGRKFGLEAGKPNLGNAIYVVDADTGDLIFWIGHDADSGEGISASGADIEVSGMNYAIASNVNVFDSNGDGVDDRLYVGDTAGNVWRVDLGADIGGSTNPQGSTVVGHFANLSTAGTLADERRIFYRPAVVQVRDTRFSNAERGAYDYVVVGTGNRANPLATGTDDRLYALRDVQTGPMAGSNGIATGYPKTVPAADGTVSGGGVPIVNADLVKVDSDLTTGLTSTIAEKAAEGWYLDLKTAGPAPGKNRNQPGEKVLAPPLVLSGNILFSSYYPQDPDDPCEAKVGSGRAYNLGILTGRAGLNWDGSDPKDAKTTKDAVYELKSGGIPPQVVPIYTTEGIKYLVGKETPPGTTENAAVKTYWYLERE